MPRSLQQPPASVLRHTAPRLRRARLAPVRCQQQQRHQQQQQSHTAVVVGAGIAGLLNAHVLAPHFESVLVVDNDPLRAGHLDRSAVDLRETDKGTRRGVTQYHHLHCLAAGGLAALDDLFGGEYTPALVEAGGLVTDVITEFSTYHPSGRGAAWKAPPVPRHGPVCVGQATRHTFESVTRRLVLEANPNVQLVPDTCAVGLILRQDASSSSSTQPAAVGGVMLRGKHERQEQEQPAALVVDCSGRRSAMPQWLDAAGCPAPRVSVVDASLGYASWLVRLDPAAEARLTEAGDCWHPVVAEVLAGAQQVSRASRFHKVSSTWRHYQGVAQSTPNGVLVAADAVASVNPIYGSGMTVAALQARCLRQLLARRSAVTGGPVDLSGVTQEFQAAITPIIQNAWDLSVGGDLRYASTQSNGPPKAAASGVLNAYFDLLVAAAPYDARVTEALLRVMHLIDVPSALMQPEVLGRAAMHALASPFRRASSTGVLQAPQG